MILLVVAAAAAAAAADIADEPLPVGLCHTNGFPAATCAAVKNDCVQNEGFTLSCHPGGISPHKDVRAAVIASTNNIQGCLIEDSSFKGADKETTLALAAVVPYISRHFSPSFPPPKPFETSTNPIPGTSCKAPCTTAECDRFCDGAGCAAHCTGSGCAGGCTGDVCAYLCTGDRCGAGAVGRLAAAACGYKNNLDNGAPNCGTGCVGGACASSCIGHGCGAMCTGRYCATYCGYHALSFDPTKSIGCGAHCVGENCAYECKGLGCGVGARDKATDPFTTQCGDYKYEGHCGKLTALAGLRCAWRDGECVDDPPGGRSGIKAAITTMTVLTTTALVGAAVAPK